MTAKLPWYCRLGIWMFGPIGGIDTDCSSAGTKPSSEWPKNDCIQTIPTRDLSGKTHHVPVGILWGATDRANREDSPSVVSLHGSKLFYVFPLHWTDERCRNYDKAHPIYKVSKEEIKMDKAPSTITRKETLAEAVKRAQRISDGINQPVMVIRSANGYNDEMRLLHPSGWSNTAIAHSKGLVPRQVFMGDTQEMPDPKLLTTGHAASEIAKNLSEPILTQPTDSAGQRNQGPFDQMTQAVHVYDTDEGPVLTLWVPHKGHHFVKRGKDGEYVPGRLRDAEVLKEYVRAL